MNLPIIRVAAVLRTTVQLEKTFPTNKCLSQIYRGTRNTDIKQRRTWQANVVRDARWETNERNDSPENMEVHS